MMKTNLAISVSRNWWWASTISSRLSALWICLCRVAHPHSITWGKVVEFICSWKTMNLKTRSFKAHLESDVVGQLVDKMYHLTGDQIGIVQHLQNSYFKRHWFRNIENTTQMYYLCSMVKISTGLSSFSWRVILCRLASFCHTPDKNSTFPMCQDDVWKCNGHTW